MTVLVSVSSTEEPEIATAVTALAALSVVMAKADVAAVVEESASLYVRTTLVPSVDVAVDVNVGAVLSKASLVNGLAKPTTPELSEELTEEEFPPEVASPQVTTEPSSFNAAKAVPVEKI